MENLFLDSSSTSMSYFVKASHASAFSAGVALQCISIQCNWCCDGLIMQEQCCFLCRSNAAMGWPCMGAASYAGALLLSMCISLPLYKYKCKYIYIYPLRPRVRFKKSKLNPLQKTSRKSNNLCVLELSEAILEQRAFGLVYSSIYVWSRIHSLQQMLSCTPQTTYRPSDCETHMPSHWVVSPQG